MNVKNVGGNQVCKVQRPYFNDRQLSGEQRRPAKVSTQRPA